MSSKRIVAIYRDTTLQYPDTAPFDPESKYPEYPFGSNTCVTKNKIYEAVRQVIYLAGLDKEAFNTPDWNPFGQFVKKGDTILIKPNWVRHYHPGGDNVFSIITHPSVLRPIIDLAFIAVGSAGRIFLMDAPQHDTDFSVLSQLCQLNIMQTSLSERGVPLLIADMREQVVRMRNGIILQRDKPCNGQNEGVEFNLGPDSELAGLGDSINRIVGSDYNYHTTRAHHGNKNGISIHRYKIAQHALESNLIISVPKLKTHKKTGVTLNIKNMIGINTDKNYIPHYRTGSPSECGDEYPDSQSTFHRFRRSLVRRAIDGMLTNHSAQGALVASSAMGVLLKTAKLILNSGSYSKYSPIDLFYHIIQGDPIRNGNWHGNDTTWRSAIDINKIIMYGTLDGQMAESPSRQYFSIIDGIIAGDQNGPMSPHARHEGVLIAGFDPISVDKISTEIMGFDPSLIRDIKHGAMLGKYKLTNQNRPIFTTSNQPCWEETISKNSHLNFQPHPAWAKRLCNA